MGIHRSKKIRTTGPPDKDILPPGGIEIMDENLSQEELIRKIENLSSKLKYLSNHGDEDSEGEINKTQDTLYIAMKPRGLTCSESLLTLQALSYQVVIVDFT